MVRVLLVAVLASVACVPRVALADAVPPKPLFCFPGDVGVSSHAGAECVPKAPEDCPPGYKGVQGGTCELAPCATDEHCKDGRRCFQVDACQELRELYWTGFGWSADGRSPYSRSPLPPPPEGAPPKAWVKLHVCGQDGPCNASAECRPMGLCVPADAVGETKAKIVAAAPVAEELPPKVRWQDLMAPDQASRDHSGFGGGCRRGCSVSSRSDAARWLALPLLIGAALGYRRRTR